MYSKKLFVVLCAVGVVRAFRYSDNLREIDSIRDESLCLSHGGMCTIEDDCPDGRLVEKRGLCPEQRIKGVECCYGVSVKETRCQKRGGGCMESCNKRFIIRAADCPKYTICCFLD